MCNFNIFYPQSSSLEASNVAVFWELDGLSTKYLGDFETEKNCVYFPVPSCGAGCDFISVCASTCVTLQCIVCHQPPCEDCERVSLMCLQGVWCLSSNDQQVWSIVSDCSVVCWWKKSSQPYRGTSICTNRRMGTLVNSMSYVLSLAFIVSLKVCDKSRCLLAALLTSYQSIQLDQKTLNQKKNIFFFQIHASL